jgi:hypothetical protein
VKTFEGLMHHITGPRVSDRQFITFMRDAADQGLTLRQYTWQRVLAAIKQQAREVQCNQVERRQRWATGTATFRIWS